MVCYGIFWSGQLHFSILTKAERGLLPGANYETRKLETVTEELAVSFQQVSITKKTLTLASYK